MSDLLIAVLFVLRKHAYSLPRNECVSKRVRAFRFMQCCSILTVVGSAPPTRFDPEYEVAVEAIENAHQRVKASPALLREACWNARELGWDATAIYLCAPQSRILELIASTEQSVARVHSPRHEAFASVQGLMIREGLRHLRQSESRRSRNLRGRPMGAALRLNQTSP